MKNEAGEMEDDTRSPGQIARHWQMQLMLSEKDHKGFIDDGRKVYDRYKAEKQAAGSRQNQRKFNILYSNTEVMRSALYGKTAKPDVRRRFLDKNPVARQAAEVLERALIYCADAYDVDIPIEAAVQDYLLPGRAVVRVEYTPKIDSKPQLDMMGQPITDGETGEPAEEEYISEQELKLKYVFWEDFCCCPARDWAGVTWVAFRHTFDHEELEAEIFENPPASSKVFGDADSVPMNWAPNIARDKQIPEELKKAEVWEIWDKRKKQRLWIVNGHTTPLRIDDDPYGLESFFPLAEPPASYTTTDTIIPEPEFAAYKDQADDLDEITARISRLTRALKRRGVYDKAMAELKRLASAGDNEFIPVENYASLMQKGGLNQAFQMEDISVASKVLSELYKQRDMLVQSIYEVTGISDIIRGATNPNETLGAQQLKSQFGSLRLKRRQRSIQRWVRDLYRIKAEIIAEHFEPQILQQMTQIQITPDIMQLLKSEKTRGYQVNIETDSTIFEDAENEKKSRLEMIGAMGQFVQQAIPAGQAMPMIVPLLFDTMAFGLRGFKAGRELEDKLDEVSQKIQEQANAPKPPPPPSPEEIKAKMMAESHQMDMEGKKMDMQGKAIEGQVKQAQAHTDMQKVALQGQVNQAKAMTDMQKIALQAKAASIAPPNGG